MDEPNTNTGVKNMHGSGNHTTKTKKKRTILTLDSYLEIKLTMNQAKPKLIHVKLKPKQLYKK